MRYAVAHADSRAEVEEIIAASYGISNYEVITDHDADPYGKRKNCVIQGEDQSFGHSLDHVLQILRDHGIHCREHADRNDAETAACAAMN